MINSLIIGYGKRVKNTVIPALKLINDGNIYIYSRTYEKLISDKDKYQFEPIKELNNDLLEKIQRIFVCTPNDIFLDIVKKISIFNVRKINLYLDTPILPKISNINIEKYKEKFKNVFVSEDFYYNPLNEIIKKIISDNNLNTISKIEYINSGHSYHSLAQSRYLLDQSFVFFANKINDITKFFFLKTKIIISGKRSDNGQILIETSKGSLIINNENEKYILKLNYIFDDGIICGYNFNDTKINLSNELDTNFKLLKIICIKYNIKLRYLQEQIISFVNLISQCEKDSGKKYYLTNGIEDSFVCAVVNKINIYFDIYLNKKSLLYLFLKFYVMIVNLKK
jgi:predicted dehydrogenase